jgi:CRISPR/Cas system-associated exonuclease Cas4 (RecB family)
VIEKNERHPLTEAFQFSQNNLQDYVDCPRRFQLRYVLMQPWPNLITSSPLDFEEQMQRGTRLHHLAHQYALDLDVATLEDTIVDETLKEWWHTFLHHPPPGLPQGIRAPEVNLSAPLAGYRLMAKIDLLAADPGQCLVVVDWKTVYHPPSTAVLKKRLQTIVYRYLAVEAGATFNDGQQPRPEQVEMIYWFAQQGGEIRRFSYDARKHRAARETLTTLVDEITAQRDPIWPLTSDERRCRFCNYRSLCERGVTAGFLQDLDDDLDLPGFEIDLEQIAEVEF